MMDADGTPGNGHPTRLCPSPKQNLLAGRQNPESMLRGGPGRTREKKPTPVLSGRRQLTPPTGRCRPGAALLCSSPVPPGLTQPGPAPGPSRAAHSSEATQRDLTPMRTTMRTMTMTNKIRITSIFRFFFWYCSAL